MKFQFKAKNLEGQTIRGEVDAANSQAAAEIVRQQRLIPITISKKISGLSIDIGSFSEYVSGSELATFTRQLSTMITSGLPITDALNLLKSQSSSALAKVTAEVLDKVKAGTSLSDALENHPRVFSKVYVALVRAGEASGQMEKILLRLADTAEKNREFRAKIKGAMIYPAIILIGMVVVIAIMMIVVIPKLTSLYQDFETELPWATKFLIATSNFSVKYWWAVIISFVALFWGGRAFIYSPDGRRWWDSLIYKLPVWGKLTQQVMLAELTRTLALLSGAGVPIVEALNIVSESANNVIVEKEIQKIAHKVERGFPVSISFAESAIFPAIVGQMTAVGEETGKIDEVLSKVSHYFESESEEKIKGLTTAIEPIILMVMAVGVGFLMWAIIMPIYGIMNKL